MLLLLVVACGGGRDHVPGPGALPCVAVPASFDAPEPWQPVSLDWLAFLDVFDAGPYRGRQPTSRAVHDLAVHGGRLHLGVGDVVTNPGSLFCAALGGACPHADATGHGIPVYSIVDVDVGWELVVPDEQVGVLRNLGDWLVVPSHDPSEGDGPPPCVARGTCPAEASRPHPSHRGGAVWIRDDGGWRRGEVPDALHVFDVALEDGVLWAAGASAERVDPDGSDATLWRSDDGGRSWEIAVAHRRKDAAHNERYWRWTGSRPLTVFGRADRPSLLDRFDPDVGSEPLDEATMLVWGTLDGAERAARTRGGAATLLPWSEALQVVDAWRACPGELLILTRQEDRWTVHRSADLDVLVPVVSWTSDVSYTALAFFDDQLVLGDAAGWLHRGTATR